jgi:MMPL family
VAARLADLALRRPWALVASNLVVLAVAIVLAVGAPSHLGIGSLAISANARPAGGGEADLVIATTGRVPVRSGVYRVALQVISSNVRADGEVAGLRRGPVSADGKSTSLLVDLSGNATQRQQAAERIESGLDAGPLEVSYGGEVTVLLAARHSLAGDLWKLELLALPLALLVLVAALGPRLAIAPVVCAATAIAGALAGLRLIGALADLSLLGIAPAAVLGLALGVEGACLLIARFRDEATMRASIDQGLRGALGGAARVALPIAAGATAATAGVAATTLDQGPSMVVGCALAAVFAIASALVFGSALIVLLGRRTSTADGAAPGEPRLGHPPRVFAGFLARSRIRTAVAALVAIAVMVAAATPLLHADSRPFSAADLPAGSQAREAAALVAGTPGRTPAASEGGQSIFPKLALAAGVSAALLALVLVLSFRTLRAIPVALVALLPAAAACGLCVLVFQDGHLAGTLGQQRQGALETGAVASILTALAAVSAARAVAAIWAGRSELALGLEPLGAAESAAALTVPAAVASTVIAGAAAAVLAGSDLYSAREFGLAVAAGLAIDLVLVRVPLLAALARWAGRGVPG